MKCHAAKLMFDIDGDGILERVGWTNGGTTDAFLFLDLNGNKCVDGGHELFGNATTLPTGEVAANGFEALALYDRPEYGGNGDGVISRADRVWSKLHLWIDDDHDGVCRRSETISLGRARIAQIELAYQVVNEFEGAGNWRVASGWFWIKSSGGSWEIREVVDVALRVLE